MSRARVVLVVGAALALGGMIAGCVRVEEAGREKLGSFEVVVDFEAAAAPGDANATCAFGNQTDLCPGAEGTLEEPIPYPDEQWAQVVLDITAVGTQGTKPYPFTGTVGLAVHRSVIAGTPYGGEVFGPLRRAVVEDGVAENVIVRIRRTAGPTVIWAEDTIDAERPLSYAAGASRPVLQFAQPTIAGVQRTTDEATSPLVGTRVDVTSGEIYVTRVTGNGFNVQDVSTPKFGGTFVFAFNGIEGLRTGSKLLAIGGAVTEFQSSTQLTEPIYTPVNGLCGRPRGASEGGIDVDTEDQGSARARCPLGSVCRRADDGAERCQPDSDADLDDVGRRVCLGGAANECPPGTTCQAIEGQGRFCQVEPLALPGAAFPEAPYCGPINTQSLLDGDGDLLVEAFEGALVRITSGSDEGVRLSGLPVCRAPNDEDDAYLQVRSTCNTTDDDGQPVKLPDCAQADIGEPILMDPTGRVCFRGNQACRAVDGFTSADVRSTCNDDPALPRCELALPEDTPLTDCDPEEESCDLDENPDLNICRNTLDDFLTSGFATFGQAKAYWEDEDGLTRCATVNFDALPGFDAIATQGAGTRWRSLSGTLRQVRFRSASGFWVLDVRYDEDLEPL